MDDEQFHRISRALADPRRREILEMIAAAGEARPCGAPGEPLHCNAVVERLPIAQPTVSHHIRELALAGVIQVQHSGPFNLLSLRADVLNAYIDVLRCRLRLSPISESGEKS